jgi:hypothetical protein
MAEHEDSGTRAEEHADEGDSEPRTERHTGRPTKRQRTQAQLEVPCDSEFGESAESRPLATPAQGPGPGGEVQVPDTLVPLEGSVSGTGPDSGPASEPGRAIIEDHSRLQVASESFKFGIDYNELDLSLFAGLSSANFPSRTGIDLEVLGAGADVLFHGHNMLDISDACKAIDLHGPGARHVQLSCDTSQAKQLADALQRCSQLEHLQLEVRVLASGYVGEWGYSGVRVCVDDVDKDA